MTYRILSVLLSYVLVLGLARAASDQPVSQAEILRHVTNAPAHPRLFWPAGAEADVRAKINADTRLKAALEAVRITADHMLEQAPVVYRKDGRRLLGRSREALSRILHLGTAYRVTGDKRYAERAAREMQAMEAMPDWNPSHYLDVAEMTMAMAVGYDWFYNVLSADQRASARKAIEEKGLGPYLAPGSRHGWERGGNNWNQVCHAGMVAGVLALAEDNPERAAQVVARALAGLPHAMKVYNPDGNYPEGPGYWNYGTTFNVMLISLLESALGTDFGMSRAPGFMQTGQFMLHTLGPTLLHFNFSDCGTGASFAPAVPWFAARTKSPDLMWFQWDLLDRGVARVRDTKGRAEMDRVFPLAIIWAERGQERKVPGSLAWFARGENPIATFRTSWTDPDAVYLAIKAGTPAASHGHMDIGSFVLDAGGQRWSLDLGMQDYNGLEQRGIALWSRGQNAERWKIFRYHNRAHSTLLVNDEEQVANSKAAISGFSPDPKNMRATIEMSETYAGQLAKAERTFALTPKGIVTVQDDLEAGGKAAQVRWGMVTPAKLTPDGPGKAWLEQKGKRMRIEVASPAGVELTSWPADPPPRDYDARNPGVSIVGFMHELKPGEAVRLKVSLVYSTAK